MASCEKKEREVIRKGGTIEGSNRKGRNNEKMEIKKHGKNQGKKVSQDRKNKKRI